MERTGTERRRIEVRLTAFVRNPDGTESIAEIVEPYLGKGGVRPTHEWANPADDHAYTMKRQSVRRWKRQIQRYLPGCRIVRENIARAALAQPTT